MMASSVLARVCAVPRTLVRPLALVHQQHQQHQQQQQQHQTLLAVAAPVLRQQTCNIQYNRKKSTVAATLQYQAEAETSTPVITSALPGQHLTAKVVFQSNKTADFKYIWLRDNCRCTACVDPSSKQKLLDTPSLDVNIRPKTVAIDKDGALRIVWQDHEEHVSVFDPKWLFKYGQSFIHNAFESSTADMESPPERTQPQLWGRTEIWKNFPELAYKEFIDSDAGIQAWLDMFHKFGLVMLRDVPTVPEHIVDVVKRFAYVKETQYGQIFDVRNVPGEGTHLAFSGRALVYHTDLNYREKSPGMQLLHCLKANDPKHSAEDPGGRSMFVDGFRAARWMEENEPTAFHLLTSTPVRFSIKNDGMRYSAIWPVICTNSNGDITEIHLNNRTMQPLQAPTHVVTPFYHAYKLFCDKLNDASAGLEFNLLPGDLIAFNNRRVLHARSSFDVTKVDRHLQGCYVDIDEVFSKYDQLLVGSRVD